jgi:NADPH oxidase
MDPMGCRTSGTPRGFFFVVRLANLLASLRAFRWKQAADPRLAGLNTLTFSVWMSRGAGLVLSVDGMIILLPVCRTIMRWIRPKIRFIPLDENIWFHRQVAYSMLLFTIIHTGSHYVK